jgi:hypothetical protein
LHTRDAIRSSRCPIAARIYNANDIPAKIEGLAFGPDVVAGGVTKHTLFIANDNDFLGTITDTNHPAGVDNPNRFFVFCVGRERTAGIRRAKSRGRGQRARSWARCAHACAPDRDDDH